MSSENLLYYGDNFDILRRYIQDESVDLVYLDPLFNEEVSNLNKPTKKNLEGLGYGK